MNSKQISFGLFVLMIFALMLNEVLNKQVTYVISHEDVSAAAPVVIVNKGIMFFFDEKGNIAAENDCWDGDFIAYRCGRWGAVLEFLDQHFSTRVTTPTKGLIV